MTVRIVFEDEAAYDHAIREAQAEAWESGLNTGIGYKTALETIGPSAPEPANPYSENDEP